MAAEDGTRYGDLCRLCAAKTNVVLGINIFESEGAMRQINKKIETCLPIQVHETDELPKMICESCLYKLELFFDFRERSVRTEGVLVALFKEISAAAKLSADHQLIKLSQPLDVDMIVIQHHQLLGEQEMPNVSEMDISQMQQRDMIVEHKITLSQSSVDMNAHSLAGIDLNYHELPGQEFKNQGEILIDSGNEVRYTEENLHLIQQEHQLLTEQYRLQQDLQADISEANAECNIRVATSGHSQQAENTAEPKFIVKLEAPQSNLEMALKSDVIKKESDNKVSSAVECRQLDQSNSNDSQLIVDDHFSDTNNEDGPEMYMQPVISSENSNASICLGGSGNNTEWIYCNLCGKDFNENAEFQLHYNQHFNKCVTCLDVFTSRDELNAHRKEMHASHDEAKPVKTRLKRATVPVKKENSYKDESNSEMECGNADIVEDEDDEDDPEADPLAMNGKRKKWTPKECKECGKSYKTNYKLAEHMRKHTGEKPYKCGSCEKAFRSKIGLAQHEAKHTGQYDLSCPTCGKGFQCKSYLMVHQRVHSDVKPYPCTICGRNFKTKQSLLDHTNRHLGVKPYMCDICGRGFITKGLCKAHQKVHTGLDNRKFSCNICNKMFVSKSYLQTHLRIHTGEKPFICEVCSKGFLTRVDLRIHSTMHTGEKSYVCEMCGKAFARRDALRCHRRSHTGERPYSCDQCGQTFTQFSPMAIHKRLHTGERPYTCEVCGKAFVSRSTMMSHWKKHVR